MKYLIGFIFILPFLVCAEEEVLRDKLVKNAQRVEKGVLKDLGSLREKGCKLLKNKKCVPEKNDETKEDKTN
ncbi:MAG: hypothetical protein K2P81_03940 [Bacteriovoracaceae bacterium]|nr:hypothetical protein [Bacteriovoracaceae bacterium]